MGGDGEWAEGGQGGGIMDGKKWHGGDVGEAGNGQARGTVEEGWWGDRGGARSWGERRGGDRGGDGKDMG
jgi:hypothetical protein